MGGGDGNQTYEETASMTIRDNWNEEKLVMTQWQVNYVNHGALDWQYAHLLLRTLDLL